MWATTLSVGRIEGGTSVNTVPDWCEIEVDRRVVPGENGLAVVEQLRCFLLERGCEFEFLPPWLVATTLSDDRNGAWADLFMRSIAAMVGERRRIGVPYGTHASRTSAAGVPSLVFGPGSVAQAHTINEWIELKQISRAAEVYFRFCSSV